MSKNLLLQRIRVMLEENSEALRVQDLICTGLADQAEAAREANAQLDMATATPEEIRAAIKRLDRAVAPLQEENDKLKALLEEGKRLNRRAKELLEM
jgi:hypothetical protein